MKYIADLHTHSLFSRATSRQSNLSGLFSWARVKGIQVLGTGDFTHPGWYARLREELMEAEPGFYRLKDETILPVFAGMVSEKKPVRFVLSAEISCIYKKQGKTRKIHAILYVPDWSSAARINLRLSKIGNLAADGRPILGLDARDLLEILLESSSGGFMVPAHIWTPWFSLFGSKSGFDRIEDCFEDLTDHIFALETGLSADPEMIRLISALDRFTLVSNSDCHSPSKLGREANIVNTGFDFFSLKEAFKHPVQNGFKGTIEFYPEEGKYYLDGHRQCQVCQNPVDLRKNNLICPICGKPLTVGVLHRVLELADRDVPWYPEGQADFVSLIPLVEVLSEILGVGPGSKTVLKEYQRLIGHFSSEFSLLLDASLDEIAGLGSPLLSEAVHRIRAKNVIRRPGYDGHYGTIRVFQDGELNRFL